MVRRCIAAGEQCAAKMGDSLKPIAHAADEKLAAPDRAVISVACAVETDADDTFLPFAALRKYGGNVCAVVLDAALRGTRKRRSVRYGHVLRMAVMHDEQLIRANFVHRNQIFDGSLEGLKRLEVFEVSNVLAYECLPVHD